MKANKALTIAAMAALFASSACADDGGRITMLQPNDRTKVPVLFVHGLWDHASTWNPMVHALQRDAQISAKYQLWTFSYDTYSPFWIGAASLRSELDRIARSTMHGAHWTQQGIAEVERILITEN